MQHAFRPGSSRPIQTLLDSDPALRQLARQVEDLVALQRALQEASAGAPVTVSGLAGGTLTVVVPSAAWATRLRQSEPSLLAALARQGMRVERLKIRPQRQARAAAPAAPPKAPVPAGALAALDALRAGVGPSPLQEALDRLIARHRGSSPALRPGGARR
ncbi:DUF721 domain-containing protein [Burkholderiaceae bacterium FT117]|uniref:DciA family protein n=1 Tax=Zeimonas sediminis TaxID=2944268 RepID=UPI002342D69A|nr:DciA family protein [Zeimonas sediminis]MCM5570774.1 DUF721 domain-containing protein [Zeimonas sediminis]